MDRAVRVSGIDTSVPDLPSVLTISQAARTLRASRALVRRCLNRGQLPAVPGSHPPKIATSRLFQMVADADAGRLARRSIEGRRP